MSLCRHYVRELRRSVLVATPELEKQGSKRSSYILDHLGEMNDPSGPSQNLNTEEKVKDQNLSAFLRQENDYANGAARHSPHSSVGSQQHATRPSGDRPSNGTDRERPPRPSFMTNGSPGHTDSNSPAHTVARADIRASAEKILYTYLLPGSEREIILPQTILTDITTQIEEEGRDDPEVFDAAKDYVFQAMERDAFPGFLRAKAFGNLVPPNSFLRLCLGLLGMFGGFWAGFACILLDKPKHIRCWVSIVEVPYRTQSAKALLIAHSPLHYWRICIGISTIRYRSYTCTRRVKRIYIHELVTHKRTLRAKNAYPKGNHGTDKYYLDRCLHHCPLHFCARTSTLNLPSLRRFTALA